ncbi:MAG: VCBS repeat-containing protein, partial [Planctomycetes bacterium]|nr:VCBS repeat-containing protein [Planctomycetota bacterium]
MSITSSLRWLVASNPEKMRSSKKRQHRRRLNVESLESRLMLAAPEPVSVDPESPLANSHTSPHLANVSLTFDTFGGTLDDTMLDEEFVVHAMQQGRMPSISGDFSVSGDSIIANPGGGFFPGELVQVSATTGIQNTGGETLAQPFTWQFRAAANGGAGVFSNNVPFGNSYSWDVALGDIDGDSDLDAFFADANAPSEVWLNDGVGNFSLQQTLPDFEAIAVALGDLNGNGHLDAFVVGTSSDNVLLNDGSGNLSEDPLPTQDMQSTDVALGDIDGDGDLDALVTSADYGGKVWENDGNGVFSNSQILAGSQSEAVELGDLDGDGDLDAFIVNRAHGTPTSTFWKNDGSGNFTPQQSFGTFNDGDVVLGDVDGDGDLDALVSGDIYGYAEPTLYLNDNGMFTDSGQYVGFNAMSAVLGDLDGDSDLDIFFGNFYQGNTVWINDGNGNFSDNGQYLGEFGVSNAVATGDVDGDGDLDVLVGNADTLYNQIWLNDNAADSDGDGVPDSVEQNNPGGDTSNDPSIASLPNAVDGQYVTLTASSGALENVRAIENPSPADAPDGATFPFGLFEYEIHDLTPGQLVTVTMDLPAGSAVGSFYQFAPQSSGANEEWSSFEYDGTTGADVPSGNQLAIHFQDGARGDSDFMADGIIIDPGGPALLPANTAPTTTGISDVQVAEDAADTAVDLFAAFDDAEDTDVALTYSVESNTNTGLFASTNVAAGTLTLDYAPDANGTADIKVRATDTGGLFVETTFTITVDPVNDAPEITSLSVDQAMIFENESVTLTGNFTDPDAGDEHTVTIDWGDGTVQVETLAIDDRSFSFPHQYLDDNPNVTSQDDYNVRV